MSDKAKPRRKPKPLPPFALPVIGGVLALLALFFIWRGIGQMGAEGASARIDGARDRLVAEVAAQPGAPRQQLAGILQAPALLASVKAGEYAEAAKSISAQWPELKGAAVYSPTLDEAFSGNLKAFGYSRLAVLQEAANRSGAAEAFSGKAGAVSLELAAPIHDRGQLIGLAYGELPLPGLTSMIAERTPSGSYMALRQGDAVLAQAGDESLASIAALVPVPGTDLHIATAYHEPEPLFGLGGVALLGVGVVLLLLAAVAFMQWRRGPKVVVVSSDEDEDSDQVLDEAAAVSADDSVEKVVAAKPVAVASGVERSIFRAYDIRGVVGDGLNADVARLIGQAIGSLMREKGLKEIVVGRDGRLSGPEMSAELIVGLRKAGCDVIDIGQAPTPVVYFATHHLNTGSGVAVTGSHNPPDYNGFKIMVGGETLSGDAIQDLYARIAENRLESNGKGGLQHIVVDEDYVNQIANDVQVEQPIKVVVDAGNGVAGGIAPQVLEAIGCEVIPLHCEVDGEFPNHHPDPSDPDNLRDLIAFVQKLDADIGLAFDGDGDRLGVVTREGEIIFPDRLLMLFAQDVLMRNPGASVIYDVKCTGHLAAHILRHGGSPIMWKTGHSLIKAKMKETHAELAGEMSGHFFFKERWFGFDDGIYSAARLLEIIAMDGRDASEIFADLPKGVSTPELKIQMKEGEHYAFIDRFQKHAKFEGAKLSTIDGIRADWPDGWGLVRASNTTPVLVLRFDADSQEALDRIQEAFRGQLLAIDAALDLPF